MSNDDRFDNLFMTVAQQAQGIEPLLDQLFGFLRRKTDFYTAPPDKIHAMVMGALKKQGELYDQEQAKKAAAREKEEKRKKAAEAKKKAEKEAKAAAALSSSPAEDDVLELTGDGDFDVSGTPPVPPVRASKPSDSAAKSEPATSASNGESTSEPTVAIEGEEEEDNTPAPEGNGGSTDKFVWTQSLAEVTVTMPLPAGIKAKMLNVDIKKNSLRVAVKGESEALLDGTFHKSVFLEDTLWNIDDGNLILDLCKDNRMEWWKCVLQGDPEINTQKVQPENSKLGDLDGETRQTVEKMMFDQRQKAQGLPSSEELQKQNMMKKFMDAHPEMDFSKAKFN